MNITGIHPYGLARRAECADPDTAESPGAEYLLDVARAVSDALAIGDYGLEDFGELLASASEHATRRAECAECADTIDETINGAADALAAYHSGVTLAGGLASHTWTLWRVFVDLGGWEVDPDDMPPAPVGVNPMTGQALAAMYVVAYRLAGELLREWVRECRAAAESAPRSYFELRDMGHDPDAI